MMKECIRKALSVLTAITLTIGLMTFSTSKVYAATLILKPNGAGDYNDGISDNAANLWTALNDANDATYGYQNSSANYIWAAVALEDHVAETGTITEVRVYFRIQNTDASTNYVKPGLRLAAVETLGSEVAKSDVVVSEHSEALAKPGGGSFSWADIDNLQLLVGMKDPGSGVIRENEAWIVVTYTNVTPPDVTTQVATSLLDNAATLNGSITDMRDATTCDTYFEWDIDSGAPYANITAKISTLVAPGTFSVVLPILAQNTTYYFRSRVVSDAGTVNGAEENFTTTDEDWLYMTKEELVAFKLNTADTRYVALKAWTDAHIDDVPPDAMGSTITINVGIGDNHAHINDSSMFDPGDTVYLSQDDKTDFEVMTVDSVAAGIVNFTGITTKAHTTASNSRVFNDYATAMTNAATIQRFIDSVCTVYLIENDADYANHAIAYAASIVAWDTWNNPINWQTWSAIGLASAETFDVLHPLMLVGAKNALNAKIVAEIGTLFTWYKEGGIYALPAGYAYPNHKAAMAGTFLLNGQALLGEYASADLWVTDALTKIEDVFDTLESGGITKYWYEGALYAAYASDYLITAIHAYKISGGKDFFTSEATFLTNLPAFVQWCTYNGHYIQIADVEWNSSLTSGGTLTPIYRLAKEFGLAQGQQYADTYCTQALMQSFIWRDPTLSPTAFSGTTIDMDDIQIYRSDWTSTGLVIVHHAGTSRGHAHPASGEFQIYCDGKDLTSDWGYAVGSWYTMSWTKNTIVEGLEFVTNDTNYTIPGYGQGQEPSDLGVLPTGYHGEIETAVSDTHYWYVRSNNCPTGSPPYNPYTNWQPNQLLTIDATAGDNHVHVTNSTMFDPATSEDDSVTLWDGTNTEDLEVASVGANVINFTGVLTHNYTLLADARIRTAIPQWMTGNLNLWIRQTILLPDLRAFVVFDRVSSVAPTLFKFLYHATNATHNEDAINITVAGDVATVTIGNGGGVTVVSKVVMVDPVIAARTSEIKTVTFDTPDWMYLVSYKTAAATSSVLQNVIFPVSTDQKTVARVSVNNCSGVIIDDDATHKSLVLFSNDGAAVSGEEIELGGTYIADDGESYTFNGTKFVASFTDYQVVRLEETASLPASPSTTDVGKLLLKSVLRILVASVILVGVVRMSGNMTSALLLTIIGLIAFAIINIFIDTML